DAEHDNRRTSLDPAQNLLDGGVGGDTRVGKWRKRSRIGPRREPDDRPHTRFEKFGVAAVRRVKTRKERPSGAVHVIAGPTVATQPATRLGVQDHRVALDQVRHGRADLFDPAGVLVTQRERQLRLDRLEDPLHQVEIGPTHPGPGDTHDHVRRAVDFWLGHLDQPRWFINLEESYRLHQPSFLLSTRPYRVSSRPRHISALNVMLTR